MVVPSLTTIARCAAQTGLAAEIPRQAGYAPLVSCLGLPGHALSTVLPGKGSSGLPAALPLRHQALRRRHRIALKDDLGHFLPVEREVRIEPDPDPPLAADVFGDEESLG